MLRLIENLERRVDADWRDLIFRGLFSTIFVGLGLEHLLDDRLIQELMPPWVRYPGLASMASGTVLLVGGLSILVGYRAQLGARLLGAFLVAVTFAVHVPGIFALPSGIPEDWAWLWTVFQRSNLVKNVCLFGVCVHLTTHASGRFSLDAWLARRRAVTSSAPDAHAQAAARRDGGT
jgi:putative oxidoreductase